MSNFKFGQLSVDAVAYGSQGSAVLGIRDSGKSFTATLLAEHLFEAGIPFVAFDPIGVWRFLRVPGKGRGYPIVVAGGQDGDLPLTPSSAPAIVEAAMQHGISLVIDLFSMELSKADWRRIVRDCVRLLLHRNSQHGLRHVFIEEAAEFIPQRVIDGQVYAEVEKLARMGGNARLGYTLINQRAEEVNKAVLELCDNLFLHRQKGRNSLTALSKWLDIGNVKDHRQIIDSLSTLPTGECWAWLAGTERPIHVKVPMKNSQHPDRRVMRGAEAPLPTMGAVDVSSFVQSMKLSLSKLEADPPAEEKPVRTIPVFDPVMIKAAKLEGYQNGYDVGHQEGWEQAVRAMQASIAEFPRLRPEKRIEDPVVAKAQANGALDDVHDASRSALARNKDSSLPPARQRILDAIAWFVSIGNAEPSREIVAFVAGASSRSGSFANNLGALRTAGLIRYPSGGNVCLTAAGRAIAHAPPTALTHSMVLAKVMKKIPPSQGRILSWICSVYPKDASKNALASHVGVSATSGAFANSLGRLRSLGLIEYPSSGHVKASAIMFPERK